jgi:hypothetical protein
MSFLAVVEIDLIYTVDAAQSIIKLLIYSHNARSGFSGKSPAIAALHPPARAFPCRFPATPSIFVGGAGQACEITGIFGCGGVPENFFPGFFPYGRETKS